MSLFEIEEITTLATAAGTLTSAQTERLIVRRAPPLQQDPGRERVSGRPLVRIIDAFAQRGEAMCGREESFVRNIALEG
jgi:hypothetical protein